MVTQRVQLEQKTEKDRFVMKVFEEIMLKPAGQQTRNDNSFLVQT